MSKEKLFSFLTELSKSRSALMGIAILWIMLFHSGIEAPDDTLLRALWYVFVGFGGGVGVNLFFILSGFGLYYSVSKGPDTVKVDWLDWARKRLVRLLPSYLIVAVVYYLLLGDLTLFNILQLCFWIDGVRDFWFIPGILVCYCLFPFIYSIDKKCGFGIMTVIIVSFLIFGNLLFQSYSPHYDKIEIFTWRLPSFVLGVYLGYLSKSTPRFDLFWALCFFCGALLLCILFTGLSRLSFLVGTFCFLPVLSFLVYLLRQYLPAIHRVFAYLGLRSLQLYLLHVSLIPLVLRLVWKYDLILYFVLTFVVGEILYQLTSLLKTRHKNQQTVTLQ